MASDDITVIVIGALAVGAYFLFFNEKTNIFKQAYDAGARFMQEYTLKGTTTRGEMEGYPAPYVPQTPEGYRTSNWAWDINGTKLGLPAGMTPGEFCAYYQGDVPSPICTQIAGG